MKKLYVYILLSTLFFITTEIGSGQNLVPERNSFSKENILKTKTINLKKQSNWYLKSSITINEGSNMPGILPPSDDTRVLNNPTVLMGCLAVGAGVGYWVGLDKDDDISPAMGAVYGAGFMLALILLNEMF